MENYISALQFDCSTDSAKIQMAIQKAKSVGVNKVVIPQKDTPWIITETISLPDDIEILIDGAHLVLADDTFINMFATENYLKKEKTQQKNIEIHGKNGAVLDGGKYNGLSEKNHKEKGIHISVNTTMMFYYTQNLNVHDLKLVNQRWWAITNMFVENSSYKNIEFKADLSRIDENGVHYPDQLPQKYHETYVMNADGIDLRVGCNNITIENITGFTEDDTVALTALGGFEQPFFPDGKCTDIHHITIKNINSDCFVCSNVRLLCGRGHKIHDILIDSVTDARTNPHYMSKATVRIGDVLYATESLSQKGDMYNITVKNVMSKGITGVSLCRPIIDSVIDGVTNQNHSYVPVEIIHDAELDNVSFKNLHSDFSKICNIK